MKNVGAIIKAQNAKIKRKMKKTPKKQCNCTRKYKGNCPLNGKCLSEAVVYQANVRSSKGCKTYIGLAGGKFKERYNNHVKSFAHKKYKNATQLSKYIWSLQDKNVEYDITWETILKSNTFRRKTGICNLCLEEKLAILNSKKADANNSLNKRTEFISKYRHGDKKTRHARKKKTSVVIRLMIA